MDLSRDRKIAFPLPPEIGSEEVAALVEALRGSAASGDPARGTIELVEVKALGIEGPGATDILLVVSGLAGAWFTKKWADEYIWPIVKQRVDRPSKRIVEWLDGVIDGLIDRSSGDEKDSR